MHYWNAVFACAVALGVAGCGATYLQEPTAPQFAEVKPNVDSQALYEAAQDECNRRHPPGKRANAVPWAKCVTLASDRYIRPNHPYPDLLNLSDANRLALAEKIAKGQLSVAEATQQSAAMNSQIVAEAQRRSLATRAVTAQEQASEAQRQAAFAQQMQAITAEKARLERPDVPVQRSLTNNGINCTSTTQPRYLAGQPRVTTTNCQ